MYHSHIGASHAAKLALDDTTTEELYSLIAKEQDEKVIEEKFIGASNKELVEALINDCNRIVLGWGKGLSGDKWKAGYLKSYRKLLGKPGIRNKCLWFGPNGDGSPRHPADSNAKKLTQIKKSNFKRIFE